MDCQIVSRFIFLLFIIVTSVYFLIINKRGETEPFVDPPNQADQVSRIKNVFRATVKREPTSKEVTFYMDMLAKKPMNDLDLAGIILSNKDANKTGSFAAEPLEFDPKSKPSGKEDDVILAFNIILDRNPDMTELRYFSNRLRDDKDFNDEKLRQILVSSDEYTRLHQMQSNNAGGDMLGNVTDRQLTFVISSIYKQEAKQPIDPDTLKFLKKRYAENQMSEDALRKFIKKYVMFEKDFEKSLDDGSPTGVSATGAAVLGANLNKQATSATASGGISGSDAADKQKSQYMSDTATNKDEAQLIKKLLGDKPNQELIDKLLEVYADDGGAQDDAYLSCSRVIDTIKEKEAQSANKCAGHKYNKAEMERRLSALDRQLLAELVHDRNMNHMKNVCRRNTKYINADDNMVLFPEFKWMIPQKFPPVCMPLEKNEYRPMIEQTALIGTLLEDASKTKVGSILPETPPTN
jgi:hypothetical protein